MSLVNIAVLAEYVCFLIIIITNLFFFINEKSTLQVNLIKFIGSVFILLVCSYNYLYYTSINSLLYVSIGFFILSVLLHVISIISARKSVGKLNFALNGKHSEELIFDGPYRYIRHPIYTSYICAWLGAVFLSWPPVPIVALFVMGYFYFKAIKVEEDFFLNNTRLSSAYKNYCKKTYKILPFIY